MIPCHVFFFTLRTSASSFSPCHAVVFVVKARSEGDRLDYMVLIRAVRSFPNHSTAGLHVLHVFPIKTPTRHKAHSKVREVQQDAAKRCRKRRSRGTPALTRATDHRSVDRCVNNKCTMKVLKPKKLMIVIVISSGGDDDDEEDDDDDEDEDEDEEPNERSFS